MPVFGPRPQFGLSVQRVRQIEAIISREGADPAPVPRAPYHPTLPATAPRVMLAVETFKRHMTDEGWQLQAGLAHAGFQLYGRFLPPNEDTDVMRIERTARPGTVVIQDQREWDPSQGGCFDKRVEFHGCGASGACRTSTGSPCSRTCSTSAARRPSITAGSSRMR